MSKSIYLDNSDKNIDRWVWNYAPFLRYRYKFSKRRSIQLNYRGRSSQPSMAQLQPVADISNPTNIIQGNPKPRPIVHPQRQHPLPGFQHRIAAKHHAHGRLQMTQNSIISKSLIKDDGTRETTYANVNGVWSGRVMNMFSMPLRNKKWSLSNHVFVNANRSVGFNNGQRNASLSFRINESPGITFRPDHFELELRPRYSMETTFNSVQKNADQTVHTYGGRFDGTYYTPWGLTLQSDINYSATSGYAAGYDTRTWMWNATISQQFLRNKALTLAVKVYDPSQPAQQHPPQRHRQLYR